ncbi:MAG: hypothetical protein US83_C0002G0092 [Candidatus Falkowbacteria bacterium GW2011_GWC2_38_22]|uniref:Uncharacterized protein n=1 Tax=Candidatus Falkowbacteria bacterium GW2011_GWE1_38_31 TaxID=1618638 RepID=A0A0G0K5I3_9BACT|nr:MAG: hypothetical protein US73_C0007G0092 [Candidatus Falkowbacteria bacterium GW2011_GWF2_38_1205]KKQ62003.1 MAG: hypothetical protein US83_C0002G0092 [Candidatus Falkowbacteria bacterium GW2011_GWC2_38_22]KKQ63835.1 MAG: hypothetical protein US84_C0003G0025 [Candidatus Falkowbacteria bacterium GW2011_GWF1_38_22]KKQ66092.1 MAG: hypothetical protein US87_C0003G0025 [Candidatus Falkowbacteria bacterium GW2011_GWE2_38_254]KKQ70695.1 MAG: hypothetical protein US91_C0003G0025 [Candidatus Falkowb
MKKNLKISTKKIFRYSFWLIIFLFIILTLWLASFLNEYVYEAMNADAELLLSQRKTVQEGLDTKSLDEVLGVINNKSKNREVGDINNIFD